MTGHPTIRPAPVTAAAVLLIVVAANAVLAALAFDLLVIAIADWMDVPSFWAACIAFLPVPPLLASLLVYPGLNLLTGKLRDPFHASIVCKFLGVIGCCCILVGLCLASDWIAGVFTEFDRREFAMLGGVLVGFFTFVSLIVAGTLLANHEQRYLAWQASLGKERPLREAES